MIKQPRHLYQTSRLDTDRVHIEKIMAVFDLVMVLAIDTSDCERGYALMRRLKTADSNQMSNGLLNDMMFARLHGPKKIADFNLDRAITLWLRRCKKQRQLGARPPYVHAPQQGNAPDGHSLTVARPMTCNYDR